MPSPPTGIRVHIVEIDHAIAWLAARAFKPITDSSACFVAK